MSLGKIRALIGVGNVAEVRAFERVSHLDSVAGSAALLGKELFSAFDVAFEFNDGGDDLWHLPWWQ